LRTLAAIADRFGLDNLILAYRAPSGSVVAHVWHRADPTPPDFARLAKIVGDALFAFTKENP
jgi:hypothetical protein